MTDDANVAIAEPPAPAQETRHDGARPKKQPPYAVVLHNDPDHSFQFVIDTLMKVFGYPVEKSFTLTKQVHDQGKGIVWSGTRELAELKRDQIASSGPDIYAGKKIDYPLKATIEPLP